MEHATDRHEGRHVTCMSLVACHLWNLEGDQSGWRGPMGGSPPPQLAGKALGKAMGSLQSLQGESPPHFSALELGSCELASGLDTAAPPVYQAPAGCQLSSVPTISPAFSACPRQRPSTVAFEE